MKIWSMACSALAILSVAGCNKAQTLPVDGELKHFTINANREAPKTEGTKAGLEGMTPVFYAGDEICVWDNIGNNKFTTELGGAQAEFEGEARELAAGQVYTIVSPYGTRATSTNFIDEDYFFGGSSLIYKIPEVQIATPGSADPKALISVAHNGVTELEGSPINLVNLVALMKIEVPAGLKVREIQVGGGAGSNIAISGKAQYFYNNGNFALADANVQSSVITVVPQAGEFIEAGTYYVAVMPRQVAGGIAIAYVNEDYQLCTRKGANTITFNAGEIKDFGTLDANYTATTGTCVLRMAGDEIQFTGRLKKIAGGAGTATTDDNVIEKIVLKAHSLYSTTYKTDATIVSSGAGTVPAYAVLKGTTMYIYTEAARFTLHATSSNLFRNFAALKEVTFNNVDTQANTSIDYMFRNDNALEIVDFGVCDLSTVTNMSFMFQNLASLKVVRFGKTATTACTNFKAMLSGCINVSELNLGPNFTVSHLSDKTMCNNAFYDTAKAFGPTVEKCKLYMSQAEYNECTTGSCTNSALNKARFYFTPAN